MRIELIRKQALLAAWLCVFGQGAFYLPLAALADNEVVSESETAAPKMLKGQIDYLVPQGTSIKLKLATVPTNGMRLLDRDMDGNFLPAKVGQEITARTSEDLYVDENKVIPEGTVFHGEVSKIFPPRRAARPGSLQISFNSFTTPDGRDFAFNVEANTTRQSTKTTKMKGVARVGAHAFGGAIVGALVAYQIFGLHNTIAMHGYNIAGGAAGGALLATGFALMDKGAKATLEPGDDLNMQIDTDLLLPAAVEPTVKAAEENIDGLDIKINNAHLLRDGLGGRFLRVDMLVKNDTNRELNSIDLYCEDTNGNRNPVCGGTEIDVEHTEYIFTVHPHSRKHISVSFEVEFPKLKRKLVWLDHDDRQICYRQPLP